MLMFRTLKWKNFLSTGDTPTTIQLDRSPTTLIVGHNGAGKSTILDALSFALFGKPHRNINKPQLVNSINQKHCEVEVEFTIGKHEFKVIRGIKPTRFEIHQNGIMINQDAASRDYQKYLEQNILKLNHKSFHQIVVLGSSSFIPFMQLPAGQRRSVIEDLLDIGIFSKMNLVLKEKAAKLKDQLKDAEYQIELIKDKINIQRKYIQDITDLNDEQISYKQNKIKEFANEIHALQDANNEISEYVTENQRGLSSKISKAEKKQTALIEYNAQFKAKMSAIVSEAQFFENNDSCPTCDQDISPDLKTDRISTASSKAKELQDVIAKAKDESESVKEELRSLNGLHEDLIHKQNHMHANNRDIEKLNRMIGDLEQEIIGLTSSTGDASVAKEELESLQEQRNTLTERKLEISDSRLYNEVATEMLKDSGIKTKIIKEYLPVMNHLINQYLQTMDFFVSFNLDESFNEVIKSRHRDTFNYASFSEGEKQRIDLSLLFAWRQIAKMKNSTNTNLLILDETFDSSLDHDGVDNLLKILGTLDDNTNTFVISHKGDILEGKFRSKIEFKKEKNFSLMSA